MAASNPPFELEDQTDEDFFDKLVNDDDDDVVVGSGGGLKSTGLLKPHDILSDGNESDEAKAFANLSISEVGDGKDDDNVVVDGGLNISDGVESNEAKSFANLSIGEVGDTKDDFEVTGVAGGDNDVGEQKVEAKEQVIGDGVATTHSLVSSDSFSLDNGHISEDGVVASVEGNVKEVQWSSFTDSADNGSGAFGSYSDFFSEFGGGVTGNLQGEANTVIGNEASKNLISESSYSNAEFQVGNGAFVEQSANGTVGEQSANGADVNSTQYWENLYPGWKYDPSTGQWYQIDGCDGTGNVQENFDAAVANLPGNFDAGGSTHWATSDVKLSQVSHARQDTQSAVGTVSQFSTTDSVSGGNNMSQQNGEHQYPAHMVFDPQYPGWYYDTIAQEWRSLDTYYMSTQSADPIHNQQAENGYVLNAAYSHGNNQSINSDGLQGLSSNGLNQNWSTSFVDHSQQGINAWQSEAVTETRSAFNSRGGQSWQNSYYSTDHSNNYVDLQKSSDSRGMVTSVGKTSQSFNNSNWASGFQSFVPAGNAFQHFNHSPQGDQNGSFQHPFDHYSSQNTASVSQPLYSNGHHASYAPSEGRSSAGRPPHALVTFGFGGKLVIMKDNSNSGFSTLGSKDADGRLISVLNLMEAVGVNNGPSGTGASSYFHALCHQSFPGPLVGGNVGSKELNKWLDETITNCGSLDMNYGKGEPLKLLLSLLKISCQHYGKLRSFGTDTGLMENDLPESAVAKLFASAKRNGGQFNNYSAIAKCLMTLPSEAQIQSIATEVQNLLISGRKKEALQRAQEGQFWGFALILARELGDQFYADTVRKMAVSQLVAGSPLRTLCLLIAKKPEEVFSPNMMAAGNLPGAVYMSPQPVQSVDYGMLENWEENLAVITANRTENDHLVLVHLGDCLWKEKNDVNAAHICYLVADANFELYSDSARLCLIGADHLNFPRTYASPEAIQRTELFEYSKVLGNSQFVLLPLQPYKLIYAHMLAEVGRVSDSLKYCQAVSKSLKTGRSPEAETLKQLLSSLEERIRTHQQSGYAANLAPAKIVGKLLNFFDSTAHRVVGGLPPPVPSTTQSSVQGNAHHFQTSGSQSTMHISSLTPSASMEPINQWAVDGSRMTLQNRSISEPDIGRTPRPDQVDSSKEATSSSAEGKHSSSPGTSRFGRLNFGAQILQKTVGLVLKPRQGRQAKLGETNKFYYDEKLKRWVEEGAEAPADEPALAPPPTTAAFQNGNADYTLNNALNDGSHATNVNPESRSSTPFGGSPGIPAIPPSSNQFSARGRMGVRSRYVDTFNKGGGTGAPSTNLFQTPSLPSSAAKPANAKFFIPTPTAAVSNEQPSPTEATSGNTDNEESASVSGRETASIMSPNGNDPFQNLAPSPAPLTMQRFPSVDNISNRAASRSGNTSLSSHSRRTASWNGIHNHSHAQTPPSTSPLNASPPSFMPNHGSSSSLHMSGDELQEVEL